tara:strand:- start:921 stop:1625 length:705 start_codon:yes stop_codon:yes gene_type:complete
MSNNYNFQSFLFLSPKKIIISIRDENNSEEFYKIEKKIDYYSNNEMLEYLNNFLDENIFKIEKKFKNFVESLTLIIDDNGFFPIKISVKKQNYNQLLSKQSLVYPINVAKDEYEKTHHENKLAHIIIENYKIDNKDYSSLPKNIRCAIFSLDIKFICFPKDKYDNIKNVLRRYQISINRLICSSYVLDFFPQNKHDIFKNTKYLIDGCNENEVFFIKRATKNMGLFEKFFKLFS